MEKQFIPYELALVLKQLGFNEECFAWWGLKNNISLFQDTPFEDRTNSNWIEDYFPDRFTAPLWQQAFDWFREQHNLFIQPFKLKDKFLFQIYFENDPPTFTNYCNTYEEARLECLKKLIQIVKK